MNFDLEKRIKGICPSCYAETEFEYSGFQEGCDDERIKGFHAYTCSNCKSTINVYRIRIKRK